MIITIELTEAEAKAMSYVSASPEEWATNAVKERSRLAIDEIFQMEVARMLADPNTTSIPADREAVVLAAVLPVRGGTPVSDPDPDEVIPDEPELPV